MMREWLAFGDAALRFLFLNWAVHSTLILGAALLLTRLPRLQAGTRHRLLAASLALALGAPVVSLAVSAVLRPWTQTARPAAVQPQPPAVVVRPGTTEAARPAPTPKAQSQTPEVSLPVGFLLLAAWAVVALGRLVWLAGGLYSVRRLVRRARPVDPERVVQACGYRLADVPVLETGSVSIPSVAGLRRPSILMPMGLAGALEPRTLREVLLHEEAHARRRDPLYLLLGGIAAALLFWHPLAAWVRRRMEAAAEHACDAYVLSHGVEPTGYARTLLEVLEAAVPARRQALTCLLGWYTRGSAGAELKRRVTLILSGGGKSSPAAAALAGLALAGVVTSSAAVELGSRPRLPASHRRLSMTLAAAPRASSVAPRASSVAPRASSAAPKDSSAAGITRAARGVPVAPAAAPATARTTPIAALRVEAPPETIAPEETVGSVLAETRLSRPRESRCVVYVLDVSGSMRPHQEAARAALLDLAGELSPRDSFNVVAFARDYAAFSPASVAPGGLNLHRVRVWLEDLPEKSGTNLNPALQAALAMPEVTQVVIISDGEAWQQPARRASLAALIERENRFGAAVQELIVGTPEPVEHLIPGPPPAQVREPLEAEQRPRDLLP